MLVFVSDLHLTDGTSGTTIQHESFEKFALYLEIMAHDAKAKELEIVFLGDLFDMIRSEYWLNASIRPWSGEEETDASGLGLKEYALEILGRILRNENNRMSLDHLKEFKIRMDSRGLKVTYTYLIGNHDWLVNRYPETRVMAARALGMENYADYQTKWFAVDLFREEYRLIARHGDLYDPFNYSGNRDASSLGDAVVIDLINRFPLAVKEQIGSDITPELAMLLKELDNIRPLIDVPLWIQSVCTNTGTGDTLKKVKTIWNDTVDQFLKIDFVKKQDKPWKFDFVDQLQLCLRISEKLSIETMLSFPLRLFMRSRDRYAEYAYTEQLMMENKASFSVYGHTHAHKIQPLNKILLPSGKDGFLEKSYFNTGTWRKILTKTDHNDQFLGWHVMTFIAFYLDGERKKMKFEVWNGALG